jgi:ribonuclease P protein component
VDRNRLRRRLREHARRRLLPRVPPLDILIRARPPAYGSRTAELANDLDRWCAQLDS